MQLRIVRGLASVFLLVCLPGLATAQDDALERIRSTGKLRISTNPGIEPMAFVSNGEVLGFDVDFGNQLASHLGVEAEWVISAALEPLVNKILAGDFGDDADVIISAMGIDLERTVQSLAIPYLESGLTILTTTSNPTLTNLDRLSGSRVATVSGSTEEKIAKQLENVRVVEFDRYDDCIESLLLEHTDAALLDAPVALLAARRNPDRLAVAPRPFQRQWYGVYLPKGNDAFFLEIRRAVRAMKQDGTLDALYRKWF